MVREGHLPLVVKLGLALAVVGTSLTLVMAFGSDPVGPSAGDPTITRAESPSSTDTIDAEPVVEYSVVVRDGAGGGLSGTTVVFTADNMRVAAAGAAFGTSVAATTDAGGRASAMLRLGTDAGPGEVRATVGALGLADTVSFEVSPGAAHSATMTPDDTTVARGLPFTPEALSVDRHTNPIGPIPVAVESGPLRVVGSDLIGDALGVGVIRGVVGIDTIRADIRVVPDGEIVYTLVSEAWLVRFDGTERAELSLQVPAVREPSVDWSPDGDRIVVGGYDGFRVYDLTTQQVTPSSWPGGGAGTEVIWPRFAPSGSSVIYSSNDGMGWDLRTASVDATSAAVLIERTAEAGDDLMPDWSPDGDSFVFTADREEGSTFLLRVSDPDVTSTSTIMIEGVTPVWSPDGSMIAYQELGVVGVVSPDGATIDRSWNPGWTKGVTWAPGSDLLLGVDDGVIEVLDVVTGAVHELPELATGVQAVAWRPR